MTPDDAADLDHLELGKLLVLKVPFRNSSVPADPASALRYAHRLELRYKADQQRLIVAGRHLSLADTLLCEMVKARKPSRVSLGAVLGLVQAAREAMLS